ncbi:MAG: DUF309 domain-containing protein [Bacillota bacterium]
MPPDQERKLYLEGIRLFNEQSFFEAHETWEEIWHHATGAKRAFYQGLIQAAVALEHYRRSNPRGVQSLHRTYTAKLKQLPQRFMGINLEAFMQQLEATLQPALSTNIAPQQGDIQFDPTSAPKIVLEYDPFETGEVG